MNVYLWSTELNDVLKQSSELEGIYLGSNEVWSASPSIVYQWVEIPSNIVDSVNTQLTNYDSNITWWTYKGSILGSDGYYYAYAVSVFWGWSSTVYILYAFKFDASWQILQIESDASSDVAQYVSSNNEWWSVTSIFTSTSEPHNLNDIWVASISELWECIHDVLT